VNSASHGRPGQILLGAGRAGRSPRWPRTQLWAVPELCENHRATTTIVGRDRSHALAVKVSDSSTLCPIATRSLGVWPAFNFQWAWSSGTQAGRAAGQ
jgi:hypothetical protein